MFPQLLHVGRFSLPTYGVMAALGLITGLWVIVWCARRQGINVDKTWNLGVLAILSAMVGAKVLLIVIDARYYARHPAEIFSLATFQAGGVFEGGLIAAVLVSAWYIRRNHMPVLATCDVFAPGIALGHGIGRIGCFAAGCCYGKPTSLPWGVTFTNPLATFYSQTPLGIPLHPTQLYEMMAEFINFSLLMLLLRRKSFDGQVIGAYLFLYGVERYFMEFLRDDPGRGSVFGGMMTGTQLLAIVLVITGGVLWMVRTKPAPKVAAASGD